MTIGNSGGAKVLVLDRRIEIVLQAIEAAPAHNVQALARIVNLSTSRLSHLFKHAVGVNLNTFLANRRVERAAELLASTDMQIKEVTYRAGYKQAPSFVRAFVRRYGECPTVFRQQILLRNRRSG